MKQGIIFLLVSMPVLALIGLTACARPATPAAVPPETLPVSFWLEAPPEVRYGETVLMKLKLKNVLDKPLFLTYSPLPEFIVTTRLGREVWSRHRESLRFAPFPTGVTDDPYDLKVLMPGQELKHEQEVEVRDYAEKVIGIETHRPFEVEWKQIDNKGRPVRPGTYYIRAEVWVKLPPTTENPSDQEIDDPPVVKLRTERKRLVISR